ncbi:MAG: Ig-like domain-containing protein, partial [Ignavibacteriales bacterium]
MPRNANQTVTWNSSNTAVATVSSTGLVTPLTAGSATITASTVN